MTDAGRGLFTSLDYRTLRRPAHYHLGTALLLLVTVFCVWLRLPYALESPPLTPEDSTFFLRAIGDAGSYTKLATAFFKGRLELSANVTAYLSRILTPARLNIGIFYLSFCCLLLPFFLMTHYRCLLGMNWILALLAVALIIGLPQSRIVMKPSASREHFYFCMAAAVIFFLPVPANRLRYVFRAVLLWSGLSGIPPNFMAPAFVLRAFIGRQKEQCWQAAIQLATMLLQAYLVLSNFNQAFNNRIHEFVPGDWIAAILAEHVVSPVAGIRLSNRILANLRLFVAGENDAFLPVFIVLCLAGLALAALLWLKGDAAQRIRLLLAGYFLICMGSFALQNIAIGLKSFAVRYFFMTNFLLVWAVAAHIRRHPKSLLWLYLIVGIVMAYHPYVDVQALPLDFSPEPSE